MAEKQPCEMIAVKPITFHLNCHTMPLTPAVLYLPISERTLLSVLDDTANWKNTVAALDVPEIACLFLLAHLSALREHKQIPAERVLSEAIESCNQQVAKSGLSELVTYASQNLERNAIDAGFHLLPEFRISLLDEESVKQRAYLSYNGLWNYAFQQRHREGIANQRINTVFDGGQRSLSTEQSRVYREFEAEKDEHIHIQGYAGTGKSSLIKSLLTMFESTDAQVLVLAAYKQQLEALAIDTRKMQNVHTCTFTELAEMVIPRDLTSIANQNMLRRHSASATMPDDIIIRQLGVQASEGYSTTQIIKAIRSTVYSFCQSGDSSIRETHLPATYAASFDATLRAVVCRYARDLWNTLLSRPTKDFKPQIRGFHKIKWAAMNGWTIPKLYTHVLVDECHDLPWPVSQILSCSPQARATLGDDYQNLAGRSFRPLSNIRIREMVQSVRSGHEIESIVNPIIAAHPSSMKASFQGNSLRKLEIEYYQKATIPAMPTLILAGDNWGLFEWVQRLARQNINPVLMTNHENLNRFVQDCFELKSGGSRARHGELFRYTSWEKLATAYQGSSGFRRFNQLLEKGYGQKHWQETYARLRNTGNRSHVVSLIENVRNREFDNVMITPDVFESSDKTSKAAFSAKIYISATRARQRLFAPESLRHWIEEISEKDVFDHKISRRRGS